MGEAGSPGRGRWGEGSLPGCSFCEAPGVGAHDGQGKGSLSYVAERTAVVTAVGKRARASPLFTNISSIPQREAPFILYAFVSITPGQENAALRICHSLREHRKTYAEVWGFWGSFLLPVTPCFSLGH